MAKLFLDTQALMNYCNELDEPIGISMITLQQIDAISNDGNRSQNDRRKARGATAYVRSHLKDIDIIMPLHQDDIWLANAGLPDTPDNRIVCACAKYVDKYQDCIFLACNLKIGFLANKLYGISVIDTYKKRDDYRGFVDKRLGEDDMACVYSRPTQNFMGLITNEYAILRDLQGNYKDLIKWDGENYVRCKVPRVKSNIFGEVKPYKGDIYQQMAMDSLVSNQMTMLKGSAGRGKSYLGIGYLLWLLEKHKIEKIILFANPVPVGDACKLGFYPGSKDEKLLDSQVGQMLASKLGDRIEVERMIADGRLMLLPMSDCRGFDTTGMGCVGVYITEAQNFSVSLMKLAIQRIGEDSIVIIDGDYTAQVDRPEYEGTQNGMRRLSEVFRGNKCYGEVELQNIYRSELARLADEM